MAASALALLGINFLFGETVYGARNWLTIAGYTFQPSEFVKIAFVYAGGATLDRLFARRNVFLFIAFTGACVGALALMGDFGTASIFFAAFLVIVYLRSGDIATIALVCSGVVLGGFVILSIKPYIANRFAAWGHVWEYAHSSGYQQTRTMSAAASGGLFGFGPGSGWLKQIAAADTDLVFGMVCEELGLLIGLAAIAAIAALALFSIKSAAAGRSSFYVIGSCAAASMLVFQTMLNVFGSVDVLPLTGVTFPFVSNGGTSLVACWGLLAFIKAADIRQNASFAVKLPRLNLSFAEKLQRHPRRSEDQYITEDTNEEN
jgi:cell division protein FtsW (lipid II flippase)